MDTELIPVTSMDVGEEGIIQAISGGGALTSRLAGMGIVSNARIKVLRKSGGLTIVQATDTRVALGRGEASKIMVFKVTPTQDTGEQTRVEKKFLSHLPASLM